MIRAPHKPQRLSSSWKPDSPNARLGRHVGRRPTRGWFLPFLFLCVSCHPTPSSEKKTVVRVAVATNFIETARTLAEQFERESGAHLQISSGSSGNLYAQIVEGAPYDVLLSADSDRPTRLLAEAKGVKGSLFTYALGRLALLCSEKHKNQCLRIQASPEPRAALASWLSASKGRITLADPRVAPYGLAARESLQSLGVWDPLKKKLIVAESVSQAFHFVISGNVEAGFVSLSQVKNTSAEYVVLPETLHSTIEQKALLLKPQAEARKFLNFISHSPTALRLIEEAGYRLPSVGGTKP